MGHDFDIPGEQRRQQPVPVAIVPAEIELAHHSGIRSGSTLDRYGGQVRQSQQRYMFRLSENLQEFFRLRHVRRPLDADGKVCFLRLFRLWFLLRSEAHLFNQLVEFQPQEHMIQLRPDRPAQILRRIERKGRIGDDRRQTAAHPGALLPFG